MQVRTSTRARLMDVGIVVCAASALGLGWLYRHAPALQVDDHRAAGGVPPTGILEAIPPDDLAEPAASQPAEGMCGIHSLRWAFSRLGRHVTVGELLHMCPVGPDGTSMLQLARAGERAGFGATGLRMDVNELKAQSNPVLLWIKPHHFIAVDPAARPSNAGDSLLVFDSGRAPCTSWMPASQLQEGWSGEALVISREKPVRNDPEPILEIKDVKKDFGKVDSQDAVRVVFPFRNAGTAALDILDVAFLEQAASAPLTRAFHVLPGESAEIVLQPDLSLARGPYREAAKLVTNDPRAPGTLLWLTGEVVNQHKLRPESLILGAVGRGQTIERKLLVRHPDYQAWFQVSNVSVKLWFDEHLRPDQKITAEAVCQVAAGSPQPEPKGGLLPGLDGNEFEVTVTFRVGPSVPLGNFDGQVLVSTTIPGDQRDLVCPIQGKVIEPIRCLPNAVRLKRGDAGAGQDASLTLTSMNASPLPAIASIETGDLPIYAEPLPSSNPAVASFRIECDWAKANGHASTGILKCVFHDHAVVEVPVEILDNPQTGPTSP